MANMIVLWVIIAPLFFCGTVLGELLPAEVKNTYSIFTPQAQRLSPLPGMIYVQGGILENTLELFPISPAKNIIKQNLFHRINAATFKQSVSKTVYGGHASLKNLGKISFAMYYVEISKKDYSTFKTTIENLLFDDEDFSFSFRGDQKSKKYPYAFVKTIRGFLRSLAESIKEDRHFETYKMLTSMVSFLAKDKSKLHDYFVGLQEGHDAFCGAQSSIASAPDDPGCAPLFVNDEFLTRGRLAWIADNFTLEELNTPYDDIKDYEFAAYVMLMQMQGSWLAPFFTVQEWAELKSETRFADCGEVSILNFMRMLFGDEKTKKINTDLMDEVAILDPKVAKFFSTLIATKDGVLNFNDLYDLRTQEARDAWAEVTSNLTCPCGKIELAYLKQKDLESCEIAPGYTNLNGFVSTLLGFDIPTLTKRVADKLDSSIEVTNNINQSTGLGTLTFATQDRGNFIWSFEERHFDFRALSTGDVSPETTNFIFDRAKALGYPHLELFSLIPQTIYTGKMNKIFEPGADPKLRAHVKMIDDKTILAFSGYLLKFIFSDSDALVLAEEEEFDKGVYVVANNLAGLFKRMDLATHQVELITKITLLENVSKHRTGRNFKERAQIIFDTFLRFLNLDKLRPGQIKQYAELVVALERIYKFQRNQQGKIRYEGIINALPGSVFVSRIFGETEDTLLHFFVRQKKASFLKIIVKNLKASDIEKATNADGKNPVDLANELGHKEEADALQGLAD